MEEQIPEVEFTIDANDLYKEEPLTDLKSASIRRMIPVKLDGSVDTSRPERFMAHTQLVSPEGPVPLQAELKGDTLEEALKTFPEVMQAAFVEMFDRMKKMQEQQMEQQKQQQQQDQSRIIVPGR